MRSAEIRVHRLETAAGRDPHHMPQELVEALTIIGQRKAAGDLTVQAELKAIIEALEGRA